MMREAAPTETGFSEIVSNSNPMLHRRGFCRFCRPACRRTVRAEVERTRRLHKNDSTTVALGRLN